MLVRYREGRVHGFVVLRDLNDRLLASGTSIQHANGNRVTNELALSFKDGSIYRETSVFSQTRTFRLLTYRLLRKGPVFKDTLDMSVTTSTGQVTIHYTDGQGKTDAITRAPRAACRSRQWHGFYAAGRYRPECPKDHCFDARRNPEAAAGETRDFTSRRGSFTVGSYVGRATRYNVKVDIGGVSGLDRADRRKTTPRYARMDRPRRDSWFSQIRRSFVSRRPHMAHPTCQSGVADRRLRAKALDASSDSQMNRPDGRYGFLGAASDQERDVGEGSRNPTWLYNARCVEGAFFRIPAGRRSPGLPRPATASGRRSQTGAPVSPALTS